LRPAELDNVIKTILDTIAAPLLARHGVGYETAGALLCTAGDNPDPLATEASFASLCGTAPVPISTGNSKLRRLKGGSSPTCTRGRSSARLSREPSERCR
jgi:transposase